MPRRKRRSRKKDKSIPILLGAPLAPAIVRGIDEVQNQVPMASVLKNAFYELTGYSIQNKKLYWATTIRQIGLTILGIIGHKVASRSGINRFVKKATFGYLSL